MKNPNKKHDFKCDSCGKFIAYKELEKDGGASSCHVPDSHMSYEETTFRCKTCTSVYGTIRSMQSIDDRGFCGVH